MRRSLINSVNFHKDYGENQKKCFKAMETIVFILISVFIFIIIVFLNMYIHYIEINETVINRY